jgi:hypothetical protein
LKAGGEFRAIISPFKGWISHAGHKGLEEGAFVSKEGALE